MDEARRLVKPSISGGVFGGVASPRRRVSACPAIRQGGRRPSLAAWSGQSSISALRGDTGGRTDPRCEIRREQTFFGVSLVHGVSAPPARPPRLECPLLRSLGESGGVWWS